MHFVELQHRHGRDLPQFIKERMIQKLHWLQSWQQDIHTVRPLPSHHLHEPDGFAVRTRPATQARQEGGQEEMNIVRCVSARLEVVSTTHHSLVLEVDGVTPIHHRLFAECKVPIRYGHQDVGDVGVHDMLAKRVAAAGVLGGAKVDKHIVGGQVVVSEPWHNLLQATDGVYDLEDDALEGIGCDMVVMQEVCEVMVETFMEGYVAVQQLQVAFLLTALLRAFSERGCKVGFQRLAYETLGV